MFDLYSQPPPSNQIQHRPYEFSKLRAALVSPSSTDSFVFLDSPAAPKPIEETLGDSQGMQRRLGKYHEFVRGTSDGTFFKVVRRKEFQPACAQSLPVINLPLFQAKAREDRKSTSKPVKVKETLTHSYMENRKYWDSMNSMLSVKPEMARRPAKCVYRKSKSVEVLLDDVGRSIDIQPLLRRTRIKGKIKERVLYRSRTKTILGMRIDRTFDTGKSSKKQMQKFMSSTVMNPNRTEDGVEMEELKLNIRERAVALLHEVRPFPTKVRKFV